MDKTYIIVSMTKATYREEEVALGLVVLLVVGEELADLRVVLDLHGKSVDRGTYEGEEALDGELQRGEHGEGETYLGIVGHLERAAVGEEEALLLARLDLGEEAYTGGQDDDGRRLLTDAAVRVGGEEDLAVLGPVLVHVLLGAHEADERVGGHVLRYSKRSGAMGTYLRTA